MRKGKNGRRLGSNREESRRILLDIVGAGVYPSAWEAKKRGFIGSDGKWEHVRRLALAELNLKLPERKRKGYQFGSLIEPPAPDDLEKAIKKERQTAQRESYRNTSLAPITTGSSRRVKPPQPKRERTEHSKLRAEHFGRERRMGITP